jgi:hypothetical protein
MSGTGRLAGGNQDQRIGQMQIWPTLRQRFAAEWDLFKEKLSVVATAISGDKAQ